MFIQTENTPNPNSLKFLPGRKVSNSGPLEVLNQKDTNNLLIKNLLQINGVTGVFLGEDFFSINKEENKKWEDIQHIVISYVNEHYANGNTSIIDKTSEEDQNKKLFRDRKKNNKYSRFQNKTCCCKRWRRYKISRIQGWKS